jgi:hypothetical protein
MGHVPGKKESDTINKDGKKILAELRLANRRIADGVKRVTPAKFKGNDLIATYAEFVMISQYEKLCDGERDGQKAILSALSEIPVYCEFLADVKGVGPIMAGVIISEIDISRARYPSSLWKYAGLDVCRDGRGRSRRADHLEETEYTNKDGEQATKRGLTFNPFLKTKLIGVLGPSFLKVGARSKYAGIYYDYKNRLESSPAHSEKTKGHRHNMAIRYAVKRFLVDLYVAWRSDEGLSVSPEYSEGKLGIKHVA